MSINIFLVLQGKPRPVVTWTRNGELLDPKSVSLRNSEIDTILFIRKTDRKHSGRYDLQVQIENVEDSANITLQIVGKQYLRHTTLAVGVYKSKYNLCIRP